MIKEIFRKSIPHIVALIIFAAISAFFFKPQYSGKVLSQVDIIQATGMSADIDDHIAKYGEHPQWSGRDFCGMPAYLIKMNYDGRYIKELSSLAYFLGQPASFLWVAMATFYFMLCLMGINPWLAIVGGIGYGLSTYFPQIIVAGHITKMMALAWVPGLIGSVWYAYRKNKYLGSALAGIFAAIEISTSHPQITYYFLFVILAIAVNELVLAIRSGKIKEFGITSILLLFAAVLSIGANSVQLYYIMDHTPETTRGVSELRDVKEKHPDGGLEKGYAMQWSYGKAETFNLFIPNFKGQGSSSGFSSDGQVAEALKKYNVPAEQVAKQLPSYWGDQPFTMGPMYMGALLIFLAFFAILILPASEWIWIVVSSVFAMFLAWGNNLDWFNDFMFRYLPLYNKFRTPSMALVVAEWAIPTLAVLALVKVQNEGITKEKFKKSLYVSTSVLAGIALISAVILPSRLDFVGVNDALMGLPDDILNAMNIERASMLRSDAMRSLIFVIIGAFSLYLIYFKKIQLKYIIAVITVVVLIDLWSVDTRMVGWDNFSKAAKEQTISMSDNDKLILQDSTNYRVANFTVNPFSDATTSYYHRSIGGYHAAKLRRYQDLIDRYLSKSDINIFSMLNTKYFITDKGVSVNDSAIGNAWFVNSVKWVNGADEELDALSSQNGFIPRREAVIDSRFKDAVSQSIVDSSATLSLVDYKVNRLTYKSRSNQDGVAVFSEIYYPKGWTVTIDGVESDYFRADYVLRAMNIPAGEHTIVWSFAAPHFTLLLWITRISSIVLLLSVIALTILKIKKAL